MLTKPERVSVYEPEQAGLQFPAVPVFATKEEECQHRKQRLVAACRAFVLHGLDYGFAGHLTVCDPEFPVFAPSADWLTRIVWLSCMSRRKTSRRCTPLTFVLLASVIPLTRLDASLRKTT